MFREANAESSLRFLEDSPAAKLNLSEKGEEVELVKRVELPPEGDLGKHVVIVENADEEIRDVNTKFCLFSFI